MLFLRASRSLATALNSYEQCCEYARLQREKIDPERSRDAIFFAEEAKIIARRRELPKIIVGL